MPPIEVLRLLSAAGIRLELSGARLTATPASSMSDELRDLIRSNKSALVEFLYQAQATTIGLIEIAMRACDHHGDGPTARAQMHRECEDTPPHLRADLLEHLQEVYGTKAPWGRMPRAPLSWRSFPR